PILLGGVLALVPAAGGDLQRPARLARLGQVAVAVRPHGHERAAGGRVAGLQGVAGDRHVLGDAPALAGAVGVLGQAAADELTGGGAGDVRGPADGELAAEGGQGAGERRFRRGGHGYPSSLARTSASASTSSTRKRGARVEPAR